MSEHFDPEVEEYLRRHDLLSLFKHQSLKQKVKRVVAGIKSPHETGEYKWAKLQVVRLSAPVSAVLVPVMALGLMALLAGMTPPPEREVLVQIMEPEAFEDLEEIEELDNEPIEPPDPIDIDFTPDVVMANTDVLSPTPDAPMSPQPAQFDSVAIVKSPVIMKGIFGSRSPGARGVALKAYGGSGVTEGAVLRALRWLKKYQEANGSWTSSSGMPGGEGGHPYAMTSFALLTYLAHGETPASEEFGTTVEKAIRWLVGSQRGDGRLGSSYEHQISAYALSEAYALTKIPMVKAAAEPAVNVVVTGQNPYGGWNYPLRSTDQRSDLSVMAWCVQALKAGKMAGLQCAGLEECMKKAIEGTTKNWDSENGGFGYSTEGPPRGTRASGLTGAGILSMQFLGAARAKETRAAMRYLQERRNTFAWDDATWKDVYYWYYDTQARFHQGGSIWEDWNKLFAIQLVKGQTIEKGAGVDGNDIGSWVTGGGGEPGRGGVVMDTSLCALMLQVYYRYLPTYKTPKATEDEDIVLEDEDIDVEVIL